ncbi:MAG: glycosyltransferase family A protein [Cucumibacter sp.]
MSIKGALSAEDLSSNPTVSVIIAAFNAEAFIERTLKSATLQTMRNIEIIVVDDGSTDATGAIVERMGKTDERLRLIRTDNHGVAAARNRGLWEARGEFVAPLDADDVWHMRKLEMQVGALQRSTELPPPGAAYCFTRLIESDDFVLADGPNLAVDGWVLARHLAYNFVGSGSNLICRSDLARKVGGFGGAHLNVAVNAEDYDFQLRLAERCSFTLVPLYLVGYRRHAGGRSLSGITMTQSHRLIAGDYLSTHPELSIECRRFVRGRTEAMAVRSFLAAGRPMAALAAAFRLAAIDPVRFAFEAVCRVPGEALARLSRAVGGFEREPSQTFAFADPTRARPQRLPLLMRHRLILLAREDAALGAGAAQRTCG